MVGISHRGLSPEGRGKCGRRNNVNDDDEDDDEEKVAEQGDREDEVHLAERTSDGR